MVNSRHWRVIGLGAGETEKSTGDLDLQYTGIYWYVFSRLISGGSASKCQSEISDLECRKPEEPSRAVFLRLV